MGIKKGEKLILIQKGKMIKFEKPVEIVEKLEDDFKDIKYSYFNDEEISETENGTYADRKAEISETYVTWNHPLSEVLQSLLDKNLILQNFQEFNYSPYSCFNEIEEFEKGKWRIKKFGDKMPMVYALTAKKSS